MATKIHTYKGKTIFPCEQTGIGHCPGKGWHVQKWHGSGLPWAEEYCEWFPSIQQAKNIISHRQEEAKAYGEGS